MREISADAVVEKAVMARLKQILPARVRGGGTPRELVVALQRGLADLTAGFNLDREILPVAYLQDPRLRAAYLARFTPLNADRVRYALLQDEALPARLRTSVFPPRILDAGWRRQNRRTTTSLNRS